MSTDRYLSGTQATVSIPLVSESGDLLADIVTAYYDLYDDSGFAIITGQPASIVQPNVEVQVNGIDNMVSAGATTGARSVVVTAQDSAGKSWVLRKSYIITTATNSLVVGVNSVIPFTRFVMLHDGMVKSGSLAVSSEIDQVRALMTAYRNIGQVRLKLPGNFKDIKKLNELTSSVLTDLAMEEPEIYEQLSVAQIIEAEGVMGAFPVEDRRKSDLISESAGESARFFRTSKPINMPIYRATATALTGLIDWDMKVARS